MHGLVASTGLAYSILLNKAEFVQQGVNRVARNLSQVETVSWETELAANHGDWVRAYANLELPFTVRDLGQVGYVARVIGKRNVIYPSHVLRVGVAGRAPSIPLRVTLEASHVGSRRSSEMNTLELGRVYQLDPYLTVDASLSTVGMSMIEGHETVVMFKVRNLLDVRTADPGFAGVDYPLLPFSCMVQLRQAL